MQQIAHTNGLLFDMDNTVLGSKIDFPLMKREIAGFVRQKTRQEQDFSSFAVGQMIAWGRANGLSKAAAEEAWRLVAEIERLGMVDAQAEPGFLTIAPALQQQYHLSVLTNNAEIAAFTALDHAKLRPFFRDLYARETAGELKPSPKGIEMVLAANPQVKKWLLIGDSWLDGQAAQNAGLAFAAYGDKPQNYWASYGIAPALWLKKWDETSVSSISRWFFR